MMKKRRILLVSLLGCAMVAMLSTRIAFGTTMVKMSLAQMTQSASLVVEGKVVGKQSRWDEAHRYIITEVSVAVSQTLKGKVVSPVTVRVLGGEVAGVGLFVAGSPSFEVGQEVLLLLETHPTRDYRVVGFHQGKYDITVEQQTGKKWAKSAAEPNYAPLEDLEARIQAIVKGAQP